MRCSRVETGNVGMANQPPGSLKRLLSGRFERPATFAVVIIAINFLAAVFDPFGVVSSADVNVARAFDNIGAPLYGRTRPVGKDAKMETGGPLAAQMVAQRRYGRDAIAVVLVDDAYLVRYDDGYWPPSYENQATLLKRLAAFRPKAIFLDFHYSRPQGVSGLSAVFASQLSQSGRGEDSVLEPEGLAALAETIEQIAGKGPNECLEKLLASNEQCADNAPVAIFTAPISNHPGFRRLKAVMAEAGDRAAEVSVEINAGPTIAYNLQKVDDREQAALALLQVYCDDDGTGLPPSCALRDVWTRDWGRSERALSLR